MNIIKLPLVLPDNLDLATINQQLHTRITCCWAWGKRPCSNSSWYATTEISLPFKAARKP